MAKAAPFQSSSASIQSRPMTFSMAMYRCSCTWENCSHLPSLVSPIRSMKKIGDMGTPVSLTAAVWLKASGNLVTRMCWYQFQVPSAATPLTRLVSTRWPSPLDRRSCSAARMPVSRSWLAP